MARHGCRQVRRDSASTNGCSSRACVKSRSLAAKLVEAGDVRINREKVRQPSHMVRPGDVITLSLDRQDMVVKVLHARRAPRSL
jgi:ribosomal 50S subunit-recycling heat shock protein